MRFSLARTVLLAGLLISNGAVAAIFDECAGQPFRNFVPTNNVLLQPLTASLNNFGYQAVSRVYNSPVQISLATLRALVFYNNTNTNTAMSWFDENSKELWVVGAPDTVPKMDYLISTNCHPVNVAFTHPTGSFKVGGNSIQAQYYRGGAIVDRAGNLIDKILDAGLRRAIPVPRPPGLPSPTDTAPPPPDLSTTTPVLEFISSISASGPDAVVITHTVLNDDTVDHSFTWDPFGSTPLIVPAGQSVTTPAITLALTDLVESVTGRAAFSYPSSGGSPNDLIPAEYWAPSVDGADAPLPWWAFAVLAGGLLFISYKHLPGWRRQMRGGAVG